MVEGAVAEILEDVPVSIEFRTRNPVHPFAAHLDQAFSVPIHPVGHEMAADAGERRRPFGKPCRCIVGAAGAEVGHTRGPVNRDDLGQLFHEPLGARRQIQAGELRVQASGNDLRQLHGRQLSDPGDQALPILVVLADHAPWFAAGVVVEVLLEPALDDAALFLDDQDFLLVVYEIQRAVVFQRPDHPDLVHVEPHSLRLGPVYTEKPQRLHQVQVCLARRNDAVTGVGHVENLLVDRVRRGECQRRRLFCLETFLDLRSGEIRPAVMQATGRNVEVWYDELRIFGQFDRHRRLDSFGDRFESDPHAGKT